MGYCAMRKVAGTVIYSPSDLIRYLASPYASWMDRYYLENPDAVTPDVETEDQKLIARTGDLHEKAVFEELKAAHAGLVQIDREDPTAAERTKAALTAKAPVVYQALLSSERFSGFADFLILDGPGAYQIWDTKLARAPKPYYAIQLCCYSELFASTTGQRMPEKFGIILGSKEQVEFRVEDFYHYYKQIRDRFLAMQDGFSDNLNDCPEPTVGADHGRWTSHADKFFSQNDHLVLVAGITVGQIKKLNAAGVRTMTQLGKISGPIPKLASETLLKLTAQARLQSQTRTAREKEPDAAALIEIIAEQAGYLPTGLAALPPAHKADVFFDMEGYPLAAGGLEYLFGVYASAEKGALEFQDWWAQNREEEKSAFEGFVDWVFKRWRENPGMHIYHYASYEVNAIRKLSTRHDTRQDEVDQLLRHEVFVDLYQVVRQGVRIGEDNYSIKTIERLYRGKRSTEVVSAIDSIVRYAQWLESGEPADWTKSPILKSIRDYNEDDCKSTEELHRWLRDLASKGGIAASSSAKAMASAAPYEEKDLSPEVTARLEVIGKLREKGDTTAVTLADLMDFHRREEKPMWWRMFDRAAAGSEELRDDSGCIQGVQAVGSPQTEKQSQIQSYRFDPAQECKLAADGKTTVMFTHNLDAKFSVVELDLEAGTIKLKIGNKGLKEKFGGGFPKQGSLIPYEYVPATAIQTALTETGAKHLTNSLPAQVSTLIGRVAPAKALQELNEAITDSGIRVTAAMNGGCLVVQGPPGTGKTFTAAKVINALLSAGKKVGVASNSHKAVVNLLLECGKIARDGGSSLRGIKVGGEGTGPLFVDNPHVGHVESNKDAAGRYIGGVVGGTAWLFTLPEWEGALDFLFIDEAGQVSLANAIAMARCGQNLVLLGDQMQLEQPIQGTHPGDAGLSSLQYALKDLRLSRDDAPVFYPVVPSDYGLFLGETRRMHPSICKFISESIYEGRLNSHPDCAKQRIALPEGNGVLVRKESGVVFIGIEHDGNIQQSDEEVVRVKAVYEELLGRNYTAFDGGTTPLTIKDFLFITPYNAQVRALQAALPGDAKVGSVDKFQGLQAPVCILSLCSSYGEYGSRGLGFILDRNRINVAISRAQCMAVVVADPRIAVTPVNSLADMSLVNLFCKITSA